ncbi:MAG: hypothetical protein QXJ28_02555 [Candidatus Pacearchaeota archaeon]
MKEKNQVYERRIEYLLDKMEKIRDYWRGDIIDRGISEEEWNYIPRNEIDINLNEIYQPKLKFYNRNE